MRYFLICLVAFTLLAAPAFAYVKPAPVDDYVAVTVDVAGVLHIEIMNGFTEFEIQPECCGGIPVFTPCQEIGVDLCSNGPWWLYATFTPDKWTDGLWFDWCGPNGDHIRLIDNYAGPYQPYDFVPGLLIDEIKTPETFINEIRYYSFCIEADVMTLKGNYNGMLWLTLVDP